MALKGFGSTDFLESLWEAEIAEAESQSVKNTPFVKLTKVVKKEMPHVCPQNCVFCFLRERESGEIVPSDASFSKRNLGLAIRYVTGTAVFDQKIMTRTPAKFVLWFTRQGGHQRRGFP